MKSISLSAVLAASLVVAGSAWGQSQTEQNQTEPLPGASTAPGTHKRGGDTAHSEIAPKDHSQQSGKKADKAEQRQQANDRRASGADKCGSLVGDARDSCLQRSRENGQQQR